MTTVYAPGCALLLYKPQLAEQVRSALCDQTGDLPELHTCCRHQSGLPEGSLVINTCPGCDRRYRHQHAGISTISLWEVLDRSQTFTFPDYGGQAMSIQDACPTRNSPAVQVAIRSLLQKMNIRLEEPVHSAADSLCCGDSSYGLSSVTELQQRMRSRAEQMPLPDVVVYCVSCLKATQLGGRQPRYLVDLLFDQPTLPGDCDPDRWHALLDQFIAQH